MKYLMFNMFLIILIFISTSSQPFSPSQVLTEPSSNTYTIDISDDDNVLVSGNMDDKTYIYGRTNSTFSHSQTLQDSGSSIYETDITGDGQFLLTV